MNRGMVAALILGPTPLAAGAATMEERIEAGMEQPGRRRRSASNLRGRGADSEVIPQVPPLGYWNRASSGVSSKLFPRRKGVAR